jgi:hypothetical protein
MSYQELSVRRTPRKKKLVIMGALIKGAADAPSVADESELGAKV